MPADVRSTEISELTLKQEQLITALLSLPTITAAAEVVGINERTARRWLKKPQIQEAYKAAREKVFDEAIASLKASASDAVDTLKNNLSGMEVPPAVQVRAAQIILELAIELHEMNDLRQKVAELDMLLKQQKGTRW